MAYVAGNFLSLAIAILSKDGVAIGEAKMVVFERAWTDDGVTGLFQLVFSPSLSLDVPAAVVLLIATFGFYRAFRGGVGSSWFGWGFVASLPVSLWFLPTLPFAAPAFLINLAGPGIDMSDPSTRTGVVGLALTGLYCVGVTTAVRGPRSPARRGARRARSRDRRADGHPAGCSSEAPERLDGRTRGPNGLTSRTGVAHRPGRSRRG